MHYTKIKMFYGVTLWEIEENANKWLKEAHNTHSMNVKSLNVIQAHASFYMVIVCEIINF